VGLPIKPKGKFSWLKLLWSRLFSWRENVLQVFLHMILVLSIFPLYSFSFKISSLFVVLLFPVFFFPGVFRLTSNVSLAPSFFAFSFFLFYFSLPFPSYSSTVDLFSSSLSYGMWVERWKRKLCTSA
jgi:hypothetical protein